MQAIGERLYDQAISTIFYSPLVIAGGSFMGFTYAAFAELPLQKAAKAWAIWVAAEYTILSLGSALTTTHANLMLIKATLFTITSVIGLDEIRKQKLLGDRMFAALILIRSMIILGYLTTAAVSIRRIKAQATLTVPEPV